MTVRRVELETQTGFEMHFVVTMSNIEAMKLFHRPDLLRTVLSSRRLIEIYLRAGIYDMNSGNCGTVGAALNGSSAKPSKK
jgi:hypothetical protein